MNGYYKTTNAAHGAGGDYSGSWPVGQTWPTYCKVDDCDNWSIGNNGVNHWVMSSSTAFWTYQNANWQTKTPPTSGWQLANHGVAPAPHLTYLAGSAGNHRRILSEQPSSCLDSWRIAQINDQCCGEDDHACVKGTPTSCDAGCAAVFLPFWRDCQRVLTSEGLSTVVALCEAAPAYQCICADGWSGVESCDHPTGCDFGNPCKNGGTCVADGGDLHCECTGRWSGVECEKYRPVNCCSKCCCGMGSGMCTTMCYDGGSGCNGCGDGGDGSCSNACSCGSMTMGNVPPTDPIFCDTSC